MKFFSFSGQRGKEEKLEDRGRDPMREASEAPLTGALVLASAVSHSHTSCSPTPPWRLDGQGLKGKEAVANKLPLMTSYSMNSMEMSLLTSNPKQLLM